MSPFLAPPRTAAWTHRGARTGFEVVYVDAVDDGHLLTGCTTAVEDGEAWVVDYEISVDRRWHSRTARIAGRSSAGSGAVLLETDGDGHWQVDGDPAPHLDGCLDVDLESSALTNAFPVHRLALRVGERADAPAAWVRARALRVELLEQDYLRLDDDEGRQRYDYAASALDFRSRLTYDDAGLVLDYPGIAVRAL